ncbi:ATP-binding protein [Anianabacter salinae]|uniref:ATP-binding protein n=1 Tax=Anianabacter salinae TaxID=2851023 RepID=UPI00225DE30D|nr:ATP-binding protein [Anianabacter salinae]MBV0912149.1 two-component sensor histidine kinase [Anianabacter salinae]
MGQDLLASLLSAAPLPAVHVQRDERVAFVNDGAMRLFGQGIIGRHYITVFRQPNLLDCVEAALRDRQVSSGQFLTSDAGREVTYRVVAAPVEGAGQQGVVVYLEDMTHMQDAVQMRRDFIANVSHELKTPLTALTGFIETLRGPAREDAAARERFLEIMDHEARRMNRLVQDLLSLSRVESEERMRPTDTVDLGALIERTVLSLQPLIDGAGSRVEIAGAAPGFEVTGDADQLLQVFSNLIENAVKYGGDLVTITVSARDYDGSIRGPAARIDVTDNGEGIDELHLPRLMERFYRIDGHRSREMGGTGLGLAIVKHIVNRHRGRVRVESEKGRGSVFSVVLPLI